MNNLVAWSAHREAVRGLNFSPDDERFAMAHDDSIMRVQQRVGSSAESRDSEERTLTGHGWNIKCIKWYSTTGLLTSGSEEF
jgi:polyadenylation factor subunit 2